MAESGEASSSNDGREQERLLPIANVGRIMKQILPPNAKISKEAKETMQECVSEFIGFVTGEASEKCRKERRKTVNGDDICWAMATLGFDDYAAPLKRYLERYREIEVDRANQNKASNSEDNLEDNLLLYTNHKPQRDSGTTRNSESAIPISAVLQLSMAGGAAVKNLTTFDEAWPILQEEAINKLVNNFQLEGPLNRQIFTSEDFMRLYTTVYNVASPNILSPEVDKLYNQYKRTFEDYISSKILPSLRGKESNNLLNELSRGWKNHKTMLYWLSRFFYYLERYYIQVKGLPSLVETSHSIFYNKVYGEIKDQVIDAIASLIERDREGEQADLSLAKQVLSIFEEIGGDALKNYEKDIEVAMVEASAEFYSKKALDWMATLSYEDYMLKVEQCLEVEKSRASEYLKLTNKNKVLEVVRHELLNVHASKLEEKRASSCM
ncbi:hypothetical protein C2S52_014524 [Perilla frutescens var. hirtella]|nr:hypothetical protein C2S52_014524 [Perilla frutescens var. hirtella]